MKARSFLSIFLLLSCLFLTACPAVPPGDVQTTTTTASVTTAPSSGPVVPPVIPPEETASLTASASYAPLSTVSGVTLTASGISGGTWTFTCPEGTTYNELSGTEIAVYPEKAGIYTITAKNGTKEASCTVAFYDDSETVSFKSNLIKYVGRTVAGVRGQSINNCASGFEVYFYGKTLKAKFTSTASNNIPWGSGGESHFSVFIDGETNPSAKMLTLKQATNGFYTIAEFDTVGLHRVRIQRQTEARYANALLNCLQVEEGGILPLPADETPKLKIEAFGDSITAGFGSLRASGVADEVNVNTASSLHTYAALAAFGLNAEYSAMAVSAGGLNHTLNDSLGDNYLLKNFYERAYFEGTDVFPASSYVPDVIIINIGTNDKDTAGFNANAYKASYVQLIENLYNRYGNENVAFFLCSGFMDDNLGTLIDDVVATVSLEGILAISVRFAHTTQVGHPCATEQQAAAVILESAIRATLGLDD